MKPLVSVIMPVYNAEKYIKESIDSLMNQTYEEWELILIDDCGTDCSMEIVNSYLDSRMIVLHNEQNKGIAYSRNRGLNIANGKYIAILDDDDISASERLEKQVSFLENNDVDVVGGEAVWINEKGKVIRERLKLPQNSDYIKTSLLFENMYNNSEMMFKKKLIMDNEIWYSDGLMGMEDFKFWIDCSKVGKFSNISDCVLMRRMMKENMTSRMISKKKEERNQLFRELQEYSLRKSGFFLSQEQQDMLFAHIGEERVSCMMPKEQFVAIYDIFRELIRQCRELMFADIEQFGLYMKERLKRCL